MKTRHYVLGTYFLLLLITWGCNNSSNNGDGSDTLRTDVERMGDKIESAVDTTGAKLKDAAQDAANALTKNRNYDSGFVADAITSNNEELKLLQYGAAHGRSAQLKKDAAMMIADHRKLGKQLADYSKKKGYPVPVSTDAKGNEDQSKLDRDHKPGNDWDKAWTSLMVDEHKDDISRFEHAQDKVSDADLKMMISNTLPVLRHHLDMAETLQQQIQ